MRLVDYIQSCELEPNLPDGTVVDREEIGRLLAGEAATRSETKLARALTEQLYTLVGLSTDVSIAFTCPSRVFLVETANRSEIKFDPDRALAHLVVDLRAEVENEYETMLALLEKDQSQARCGPNTVAMVELDWPVPGAPGSTSVSVARSSLRGAGEADAHGCMIPDR